MNGPPHAPSSSRRARSAKMFPAMTTPTHAADPVRPGGTGTRAAATRGR
jgi:hypothetical protein